MYLGYILSPKKSAFEGYISMPTLPKVVGKPKYMMLLDYPPYGSCTCMINRVSHYDKKWGVCCNPGILEHKLDAAICWLYLCRYVLAYLKFINIF